MLNDMLPQIPVEDSVFGAWSARPFRSHKVRGQIVAATRAHEDYLLIMALDPEVAGLAEAAPDVLGELAEGRPDFEVTDAYGASRLVHVADREMDDAARASLSDAYAEAGRRKVTYEVVGLDFICEEPRLRNARLVHGCRRVRVGPGDRVRILHFLSENGEAPLVEVARAVTGSPDGVECVLALVIEGTVSVDLTRTLGPEMPVRRLRVDSDAERE